MRILTLISEPMKPLNKNIIPLVFIDKTEDIEEFEYMLTIRTYDIIIIDTKIFKQNKKILESLKIINKKYKDIINFSFLFLNADEKRSNSLISILSTSYKHVFKNVSFLNFSELNSKIESIFLSPNQHITILETELKYKIIKAKINGKVKTFSLSIKKDIFLLVYFLRHYNESLTIENILSGITKEPELTNSAIIESSISSLRKTMLNYFGDKRIYVEKGIGYQFV